MGKQNNKIDPAPFAEPQSPTIQLQPAELEKTADGLGLLSYVTTVLALADPDLASAVETIVDSLPATLAALTATGVAIVRVGVWIRRGYRAIF